MPILLPWFLSNYQKGLIFIPIQVWWIWELCWANGFHCHFIELIFVIFYWGSVFSSIKMIQRAMWSVRSLWNLVEREKENYNSNTKEELGWVISILDINVIILLDRHNPCLGFWGVKRYLKSTLVNLIFEYLENIGK